MKCRLTLLLILLGLLLPHAAPCSHASSPVLREWTIHNPVPGNQVLYGVARGTAFWVAVGGEGAILASTDGIEWHPRISGISTRLVDVKFANGTWVAVGDGGAILTSSDTRIWRRACLPAGGQFTSVAWGNGHWVTVSDQGSILTSTVPGPTSLDPDGGNWRLVVPASGTALQAVHYADDQWIAVGDQGSIFRSLDGEEWIAEESLWGMNLRTIGYDGTLWIAAGEQGAIITSTDGSTWEDRSLPPIGVRGPYVEAIAFGDGMWRGVGIDLLGTSYASYDGLEWFTAAPATQYHLEDLAFSDGLWIAVGDSTIRTSTDGDDWTERIMGTTADLLGLHHANDTFVAVGTEGTILSSNNGRDWTQHSVNSDSTFTSVAYGGSQWVVGGYGTIATSYDLDAWEVQTIAHSVQSVAWGNGQWVAVGSGGTVLKSTNGIEWQFGSTPTGHGLWNVAYGDGLWMMCGIAGFWSSADAAEWSIIELPGKPQVSNVVHLNNVWLASTSSGLWSSPDAADWTHIADSSTWTSINSATFDSGLWIAASANGRVFSSTELTHWAEHFMGGLSHLGWLHIAAGNGSVVAIGPRGTILSSRILPAQGRIEFALPEEATLVTPFGGSTLLPDGQVLLGNLGETYAAAHGAPVRSMADGTVVVADHENPCDRGFGNVVVVEHILADGRQLFSQYARLANIKVVPGQPVVAGQLVGQVGTAEFNDLSTVEVQLKDVPLFGPAYAGVEFSTEQILYQGIRYYEPSLFHTYQTPPPAPPSITNISPDPVPAHDGRQWLTFHGQHFADGVVVTLRTGDEEYSIPLDRTERISSEEVRVYVNVTSTAAAWTAQISNADGSESHEFAFYVVVADLSPELMGWWKFDEGYGMIAQDSSGRGNTGVLMNMDPATAWVPGKSGMALDFLGNPTAYVNVGNNHVLNPADGMTIAAWIYPRSYPAGFSCIMERDIDSSYILYIDSFWQRVTFVGGGAYALESNIGVFIVDQWYHVAFVYDGEHFVFYVNGIEVGKEPFSGPLAVDTSEVHIGNDKSQSLPFDGLMDDVRIYNVGLTQQQIWSIMAYPNVPMADSWRLPLDGSWTISQDFNVHVPNESTSDRYHLGQDVPRQTEAPVYAAANGTVKHNAWRTGYGYVVVIEHRLPNNTYVCSVYGHLRQSGFAAVGTQVTKGELIGYLTSVPEDYGTGIHLHFGIRSGAYSTDLDPDGQWRFRGYGPASIVGQWYRPSDFFELPNLVPQNITLNKSSVEAGETLTINWTLANTGSGSSPSTVTGVRMNQSSTSGSGTTIVDVPMPALSGNSSTPQSATITIPAGTVAGTYYIWIIADNVTSGAITQSNYDDDFQRSAAFTVMVASPPQGEPAHLSVVWHPSPNFNNRPPNQVIDSIVIHTVEGSYESGIATLTDNSRPLDERVSAHYIISPSGEITQLVDLSMRAWHATYYNDRSIGIEMAGFAAQATTWNPENLAALEDLVAYLVTKCDIPVVHPLGDASTYPECRFTEIGLIGHSQLQPGCNEFATKTDPGPHFPWSTFVQNVQAKVYPARITGIGGGGLEPPSTGQFLFEITAPSLTEVVVEVADDPSGPWTDYRTVTITDGKGIFQDDEAGNHERRFYRPKP